ncbi:MAG: D-lyxose/D-mannose family sugar isomerase [Verrucomicrobia bacterium]|nr:D-lyxose/D-mannose family sugar isomerase [Verrucomicrobiota bacterium]
MRRSEINSAIREAGRAFRRHGWVLPPNPNWDVTDFGLGNFKKCGLVLVNLAEQPEYCEKVMYVGRNQVTPEHYHAAKKEDIICRWGRLAIDLRSRKRAVRLQVNGEYRNVPTGKPLVLRSGERVTLVRRVAHEFRALSKYAIVGEVSTANDDRHDNYFKNKEVGRFSRIVEDEKPLVKLVSDK